MNDMRFAFYILFSTLSISSLYSQVNLLPSIGIDGLPNDSDTVCDIIPRNQGNPWTEINIGDTMADFTLYDINGDSLTLSSILDTGKKVLMVAGSYTCPIFRNQMSIINDVHEQFGDEIECFVVYTVEAHPTGSVMPYSGNINPTNPPYYQPTTYGERKDNLQDMINGIGDGAYIPVQIDVPIYIDGPCNEWWEYFNGPNNAYLIDNNGVLFAYHNWFSNSNPPNGIATNIWCDIDNLLAVNSGGCTTVDSFNGEFEFNLISTSSTAFSYPGEVIDIFGELVNNSNDGVKVNIQRVLNDLPSDTWESSMCLSVCLPSDQDTTSVIIAEGDTIDFSFHFFTDYYMAGPDTARSRIRFTNHNGSQAHVIQPYKGITYGNTSINNNNIEQISIFPNPTSNNLTIDLGDLTGITTNVRIYAPSSKLVFEKLSTSTVMIDVSAYAKGLYTIELSTSDIVLRNQVVLE